MEMTRQFLIKIKRLSGYSFTKLAEQTGLHRSHLYRLYHGFIRQPRDETVARISRLYSTVYLTYGLNGSRDQE